MNGIDEELCPCPEESPIRVTSEDESVDWDLATIAGALAHPARVRIVRLLASGASRVCGELELDGEDGTSLEGHLRTLKDAGLIRGETARGRYCYRLARPVLDYFGKLVEEL